MQRISAAGWTVKSIPLEGHFHSSRNQDSLSDILKFCARDTNLKFHPLQNVPIPVRSNIDGLLLDCCSMQETALASILTQQPDWSLTIGTATAELEAQQRKVLAIGDTTFLPRSIVQANNLQVSYLHNFEFGTFSVPSSLEMAFPPEQKPACDVTAPDSSENEIAVVGMACRFPGADTTEEFWDLLYTGKSMCRELPPSRFSTLGSRRMRTKGTRYWGNFLNDPDVFDHRFFNMSSREAASTDPQQRLVLQVAYEAMESAGYFDEVPKPSSIGCYLGVGSVDYQDNVFCHSPTAFSASGTLRAFISGKISHFFGWKGPSVTFDTACSSSAVAIHHACAAIRSGECSAALAGGVNLITSPGLYQNLDKGGFLSPSGPSKSFDTSADGYCRGEGAGLVVLKRLSDALADMDDILGIIAGSAVGQNDNCSPITVPHSESQIELYRRATSMASIDPKEISFVEAHGTGTKVCQIYATDVLPNKWV